MNVKFEGGSRCCRLPLPNQGAAARRFDERKDRIVFVRAGFIVEIDSRESMRENPSRKYDQIQMRRLQAVAGTGHRAGLDRLEEKLALRICPSASEAAKFGIALRAGAFASRMRIAAIGVRLPDFDHRVFDRCPGAVEYPADQLDVIARRVCSAQALRCDLPPAIDLLRQADRKIGATVCEGVSFDMFQVSVGVVLAPRRWISKR